MASPKGSRDSRGNHCQTFFHWTSPMALQWAVKESTSAPLVSNHPEDNSHFWNPWKSLKNVWMDTLCLSFPLCRAASREVLAASGVCRECQAVPVGAAFPVPHTRHLRTRFSAEHSRAELTFGLNLSAIFQPYQFCDSPSPHFRPHPLVSSLGGGEKGAGNQAYTFLEVKKIAEHLGAGMDADSPEQLRAASPACLPFTRCRAAWCCESREKNRQEHGGPLGRKSGAWEQLGDAGEPGQERPLRRGRAAAGTAAPLVLHIPGGNGIFGGRREPGRNSRAAFGVRPWLSC